MSTYDNLDVTEFGNTFPYHEIMDVKAFELEGGVYCAKCVGCDCNSIIYIEQDLHEEIVICDRCGEVIYYD